MARVTRLELATSGVTGRRSNQLSYTPLKRYLYLIEVDKVLVKKRIINLRNKYVFYFLLKIGVI